MKLTTSVLVFVLLVTASCSPKSKFLGPLRVSDENPRYFTDDSGQAILLAGSHTWNNLVDMGPSDPPPAFDFEAHLQWLQDYGHNYTRLWAWELVTWSTSGNSAKNRKKEPQQHTVAPHIWKRTGPELALDGKPRFNLNEFNPDYFERLRYRLELARDRGIYVSIMLFEGWGLQRVENAYQCHPFHPLNNINGVDGDLDGDKSAVEIHELRDESIFFIQKAYVQKVIDTVNDLDNILYEISNENHAASTEWQYAMIDYIHEYERAKPKQHPVGMTFQFKGGENDALFASPAEWISPNSRGGYRNDPPNADGSKVILSDTDHLWGIGGNIDWAWKSFCRGMNPIFMDPYDGLILGLPFDEEWEPIRISLGQILSYAKRLDLVKTSPQTELASSGYCLAVPGKEYLVYLPDGGTVTVDTSGISGPANVEWFNPSTSETRIGAALEGGDSAILDSPFDDQSAVLLLKVR